MKNLQLQEKNIYKYSESILDHMIRKPKIIKYRNGLLVLLRVSVFDLVKVLIKWLDG